jgi:c-di-GMP-binding flagellar brake protein YcgR
VGRFRGLAHNLRYLEWLNLISGGHRLSRNSPRREQRKWARLQLAIPVFVRSKDGNGKEALEFATALNISAGGALVVVRRALSKSSSVSLEIPSAPIGLGRGVRQSSRTLRARTIWVTHLNDYHLLGLKFTRPLSTDASGVPKSALRKAGSAV